MEASKPLVKVDLRETKLSEKDIYIGGGASTDSVFLRIGPLKIKLTREQEVQLYNYFNDT